MQKRKIPLLLAGGRDISLPPNLIGLRGNIATGPRIVEGAHENITWRRGKVNCIKKNISSRGSPIRGEVLTAQDTGQHHIRRRGCGS